MSEMIERVGKAMADVVALNYDHNSAIFNLYAKVAIKAMREPTEAMLDAGAYDLDMTLEQQYKNMIDAALKD